MTACFLILINGISLFAQFRGAPVKKDRLIKVLRSKQLQTRDIVSVINSNGVDFRLTAEVRKTLIAAGARPEVIQAVANNLRFAPNNSSTVAKTDKRKSNRRDKPVAANYEDLLDKAIYSYKALENPQSAVSFLKAAVKMKPKKPEAYQMLGYVNLYGFKDISQAKKYMSESITNGGSAVFRVYHDDNGNFIKRCPGSLFISPQGIRFESDDNIHTFETSIFNIDKIKLDTESSKVWKNHTIFNVFPVIGNAKAKFRFAPITSIEEESKMVARFVQESKIYTKPAGLAINF